MAQPCLDDPSQGWIFGDPHWYLVRTEFAGFITGVDRMVLRAKEWCLCRHHWRLGDNCCRDEPIVIPGNVTVGYTHPYSSIYTTEASCPGWKTWAQIWKENLHPSNSYLINFASYFGWAVLFNFIASWLVVRSATNVTQAPGTANRVAPLIHGGQHNPHQEARTMVPDQAFPKSSLFYLDLSFTVSLACVFCL